MSFLTGGGGGQTSTTSSNSTTNVNYAPWYESYAQDILKRGTDLSNKPFEAYDVNKMFAPFTPTQQQAFNQVLQSQTAYQPYMGAAAGALGSIAGMNPAAAGMPFINAAAQGPTGMQAGAGYLSGGTQTWNPASQATYMNPFAAGAVDYGNQLATQNFLERTIPGVNAQFVKSGGGLGGKNYADYMGRTVRDFMTNMLGQNQAAMANNYWQGANQFNADMNRYLQAGMNLGTLANNTIGALGNLGQTASGIENTGVTSGINTANAYSNLGGALSNLNLANTNALLQIGNQQQQQAQNPLTAAYQQWQQGVQFPYNQLSWLSNLSSGLRIPSTQNTQSTSTQNVSSNSSPSILGSILGAGSSILGMMGGLGGAGNIMSSLFGGGSNPSFQSLGVNALPSNVYGPAPFRKRGGHIRKYAAGGNVLSASGDLSGNVPGGALGRIEPEKKPEEEKPKEPTAAETWQRSGMDANTTAPGYRRGGAISCYSQGGTVPVVRGVNNRAQPALSSIAKRMRPPVPMPRPSTGALARAAGPMIGGGGALSGTR